MCTCTCTCTCVVQQYCERVGPERQATPTQDSSVDKVEQTEVLQQIILNGSAGEKDPAGGLQLTESRVGLVLTVLEPVALGGKEG